MQCCAMGARWVQPELVVALLFGSPLTTPFFIIGITHHASTVRHIRQVLRNRGPHSLGFYAQLQVRMVALAGATSSMVS
jgi:hypothetical protein